MSSDERGGSKFKFSFLNQRPLKIPFVGSVSTSSFVAHCLQLVATGNAKLTSGDSAF